MEKRKNWYYGTEENLKGPFTEAEIRGMIEDRNRTIFPHTLLWLERVDEKTKEITKESYPAIKTQFFASFSLSQRELAEVAANSGVRNYWLWLGVVSSIIPVIVLYSLYFDGWEPFTLGGRPEEVPLLLIMFYYMILSIMIPTLFLLADWIFFMRANYQPMFLREIVIIASFLSPVYCFLRNKRLGQRQTSALLSLAFWLLTIGMYFSIPFYTNAEIARHEMRFTNNLLSRMRTEVTAEWVSVSVQRLPGPKFEVVNHLSNGGTLGRTLEQSGWNLNTVAPGLEVIMPDTEDGRAFVRKFNELITNTNAPYM